MSKEFTNIFQSIYFWLKDQLIAEGYSVGSGQGELRLYKSFPDPARPAFALPAVGLEFVTSPKTSIDDLGMTRICNNSFVIDIFARNDLERDTLADGLKGRLEANSIRLKDYSQDPPSEIGWLRPDDIIVSPIRLETPGEYEKNRIELSFLIRYTKI